MNWAVTLTTATSVENTKNESIVCLKLLYMLNVTPHLFLRYIDVKMFPVTLVKNFNHLETIMWKEI